MLVGEEKLTIGLSPAMIGLGDEVIDAVQQMHLKQKHQQALLQKEKGERQALQEKVHQITGNIRFVRCTPPCVPFLQITFLLFYQSSLPRATSCAS